MKSVWEIEAPRREEKVFGKHPTQKSLALLERIIAAASDKNDLVLDPFSGSGTTGIASIALGRRFVGVEMDKQWLEISVARVKKAYEVAKSKGKT
jgi:site-specific DNA-methyltransferase (adenine-specific)